VAPSPPRGFERITDSGTGKVDVGATRDCSGVGSLKGINLVGGATGFVFTVSSAPSSVPSTNGAKDALPDVFLGILLV